MKFNHLKKTLITMTTLALAQGAAFAQDGKDNLQDIGQKQPKVVVIGGSTGFGISYLPLLIMEEKKLLDKHATALGLKVSMQFQRFPSSAPMYDNLVAGKIDFASGGISQLLTSWDKTHNDPALQIKGVGALNSMPLYLVSSNPEVKTIADLTAKDKIALPAVRTSIQAVILAMAAEKAFGKGQADKLETLTVSMGHPEAMKAILGGNSEINAHFASAPFMYEELAKPGIRRLLDSYEVVGGPHTHNVVWTTTKFYDANPKIVTAFVGALQEALEQIKADPAAAAALYLRAEDIKNMSVGQVEEFLRRPENEWTITPKKFMAFAAFMNQQGIIANRPADWHGLFFDNITNGN